MNDEFVTNGFLTFALLEKETDHKLALCQVARIYCGP